MTTAEKLLWDQLRNNKLRGFHFRRQQIIGTSIVDFYCHKHRLVIELDGPIHNEQTEHDSIRDKYLSEKGLDVIRFNNNEVFRNLDSVVERILYACGQQST